MENARSPREARGRWGGESRHRFSHLAATRPVVSAGRIVQQAQNGAVLMSPLGRPYESRLSGGRVD
jgi:hypothetical protein